MISRSQHHLLPLQNVAELHRAVLIIRKLFLIATFFFQLLIVLLCPFFFLSSACVLPRFLLAGPCVRIPMWIAPPCAWVLCWLGRCSLQELHADCVPLPPCLSSFDQSEGCYTWLQIWGIVVRWVTPRHRTVPCLLFCLLPAYLPACLLFRFGGCVQRVNL